MSSSSRFPQWVFPSTFSRRSLGFLRLRSVGLNIGVGLGGCWPCIDIFLICANRLATLCVGYGFWRTYLHSAKSEACFGTAGVKLDVKIVRFRFFCARQTPTSGHPTIGAGRNHIRVLAHLAQYEEANVAIIARTIFCYLLVSTPWSSFLWLLRLCRVFYWCFVYVYPSRSPLGMAASTLGRLHGIFFHGVPQFSLYRPAGESLVLQAWLMSEPFAPDPLDERIVSLSAEIQGERLHVRSLMTRLPENSFGPLALLYVYAAGTDTVTMVPVERFDIALYYMADKLEALGMGLSYTSYGACIVYGK